MATFTRVKTWVSNEVLTAADLNGEFNNLLNNMDPLGIEDYSDSVSEMQSTTDPGGVGTESLATTLAGEIQRIRFAIKRIVGGAQWYSAPVFDLGSTIGTSDIADSAVTTDKINNLAVTTGKLADGAVTRAKQAAVGQQISASSGTYSTSATSVQSVTNLSVSITTTGRPVILSLQQDGTTNPSNFGLSSSSTNNMFAFVYLIRDDGMTQTTISTQVISFRGDIPSLGALTGLIPESSIRFTDVPSAGTYTYSVAVELDSASTTFSVNYVKLVAYEL